MHERKGADHKSEQNHAKGENISLPSAVGHIVNNFGSHIGVGPSIVCRLDFGTEAGETKVHKPELKVRVNHDVFKLQVSVAKVRLFHVLHDD